MDLSLRGRRFLVTGGTSGIGFASAQALLREGARVVIAGRSEERARTAAAALGPEAVGREVDLGSEEGIQALIAETMAEGQLDGALLSVGGPAPGTFLTSRRSDWEAAFQSVFMGQVRLLQTLSPRMLEGGAIGLVLSTSAFAPIPTLAISNGLRPGLAAIIKQSADELGPAGVRVFGVAPGRTKTPRTAEVDRSGPGVHEAALRQIPLGRLADPEEIGDVCAFLLSSRASYVTGTTVVIDGGYTRTA